MLTNNFKVLQTLASGYDGGSLQESNLYSKTGLSLTPISGSGSSSGNFYFYRQSPFQNFYGSLGDIGGVTSYFTTANYVYVGSGNQAASASDTDLQSRYASSVVEYQNSHEDRELLQNGKYKVTGYITFRNLSENTISISEIGVTAIERNLRGSSWYYSREYLISRTVLASPITVAAGASFAVQVSFIIG